MEMIWSIPQILTMQGAGVRVQGPPRAQGDLGSDAVWFDGREDMLVVEGHPLKGATAFTLEALFFPQPGGGEEQRFVHLQKTGGADRVLLETRLTGDRRHWYGDTFIGAKGGEYFLNDPRLTHPTGRWYVLSLRYAAGVMEQYVNGERELSREACWENWEEGQVALGQRLNGVSPFYGGLARIRMVDRALPPEELWKPPGE